MNAELLAQVEHMYDEEATDAELYRALAKRTKSAHNRGILEAIARDERKHCEMWGKYVQRPARSNRKKVFLFTQLSRLFGLTFTINLMEKGEEKGIKAYSALGKELPIALEILEDETRHEEELTSMIEEEGLSYISSMILGLNDALVELTGALAGFTLALNNNTMIGLAGFITGVAATLSMAASEYLAKKADQGEKHPLKAAFYTGAAYLVTVALLLMPYALFQAPLVSLFFCLCNAGLIILGFTSFVSVVRRESFLRGFREMLTISFGVALISFLIGWAARAWLHLDL